jgi:hypothetical protein
MWKEEMLSPFKVLCRLPGKSAKQKTKTFVGHFVNNTYSPRPPHNTLWSVAQFMELWNLFHILWTVYRDLLAY